MKILEIMIMALVFLLVVPVNIASGSGNFLLVGIVGDIHEQGNMVQVVGTVAIGGNPIGGGGGTPLEGEVVYVEIADPTDTVIYTSYCTSNENGWYSSSVSTSGHFNLDAEALLGTYTVTSTLDSMIETVAFNVTAPEPPPLPTEPEEPLATSYNLYKGYIQLIIDFFCISL